MKILGIGGCGINIVSKMFERKVLNKAFRYAIIDLDPSYANRFHMKMHKEDVEADTESVCLFPSDEFMSSFNKGAAPYYIQAWRANAIANLEEIYSLLNTDYIHIVAGLGGETGEILPLEVVKLAKERGVDLKATLTMPFLHEGAKRHTRANETLVKLQQLCDCDVVKLHCSENRLTSECFSRADDLVIQVIMDKYQN